MELSYTELGKIILSTFPATQIISGYDVDINDVAEIGYQAVRWGDIQRDGTLN